MSEQLSLIDAKARLRRHKTRRQSAAEFREQVRAVLNCYAPYDESKALSAMIARG